MCGQGDGTWDLDVCLPGMVGLVVPHAPSWLVLAEWWLSHAPPIAGLHNTDLWQSPLYLMYQYW